MAKLILILFLFAAALPGCTQKNKEDGKPSDSVKMAEGATPTDAPQDATATSLSDDATPSKK